jgi:hypothetical protein
MSDARAFTARFLSAPEYVLALHEPNELTDVPTPAGPTPRQLQSGLVQIEPTKERRN